MAKRGSANVKQVGSANSQKDKIIKYANKPKTIKPKKQQSKVGKSKKSKNKNLKIPLYKKHKNIEKYTQKTSKI